ncbi:hypothetical protein MIR68_007861 [Amoeboaphelidium protococcarum]|nr:hypothetical protein MIR68_007861 [Amoeboaphelidium protococcarum]KAI3642843.1 hypothetical protein MP228_012398 [Amoeboaphelidium protococcarum]KAI3654577.1 hypothetical protein MP228_000631 [Amoeboaphelidium protococcarum]
MNPDRQIAYQKFYMSRGNLPVYLKHKMGKPRYFFSLTATAVSVSWAGWMLYSMAFKVNQDPNSPIHGGGK